MPVIEVNDLTVRYGALTAVHAISFVAEAGEVLALLGPNGAGKTSTVETLEGYRSPTSGRVRVLGLDPVKEHDLLTPRMGVMLQSGGVYPGIRPLEALRLYAAFHENPEAPETALERVGLAHKRNTLWRHLSGGEQQRLSLALALIGRPQVVFLDEPTSGIDVAGRQVIRQVVQDLRAGGACVLITTHDLEEAEKSADRVVIIDRGRVAASGTPAELMRSSDHEEIRFSGPAGIDTAALGKALMAAVEEFRPGEYRIEAPPTPTNVAMITAWLADHDLPIADLRAGRQRLEDVFLRLTEITGEIPRVRPEDLPRPHGTAPTNEAGQANGTGRRSKRRRHHGTDRRHQPRW